MNRADKLLLRMQQRDEASLSNLPGIGEVALQEAKEAGYVTSVNRRSRYGSDLIHFITVTEAGKIRRVELLAEQEAKGAEIAAKRVAQMGPCIVCGAAGQQGPFGTWRCRDRDCILSRTDVSPEYWLALRAAVDQVEQEAEEALDHERQHGCRCLECHVP